jgi:hypothetical protein
VHHDERRYRELIAERGELVDPADEGRRLGHPQLPEAASKGRSTLIVIRRLSGRL